MRRRRGEHEPVDSLRRARGEPHAHDAAERDAAEGSTLHAFRVEQVQHVLRERLDAVPATMLVPHQPESRLERRHLPVPDRTGRAERRREDECLDHGRIVYE